MIRRNRSGDGARKAKRFAVIGAIAVMAPAAALAAASPALAAPKGIFSVFAQCPTSTPGVVLCQFGQTTSGEFTLGKTTVPINKTITLQGGAISTGKINEYYLIPATNGESLSKTELNVPGGLLDLINCESITGSGFFEKLERAACKAVFENKTTGVTATTEIVATATNPAILNVGALFAGEGTAITLPVRVHLKNPLLGSGCYVGSESSPIELHLTTGKTSPAAPNKPISGKRGTITVEEEDGYEVDVLTNNSLVDNSFSAPVAEGCGEFFSPIIDPILDAKIGLPSVDGNNTAILSGTLKTAEAAGVVNSEK